jgi:hypothetical protein
MQRLYRSRYRTIVHIASIISKRLCVGLRETLRQKRWAGYCAICVNSEATFLLMQRLYRSRYRTIVHIASIISKRLCVGLRETLRQKRWAGYCAICVNSEATFLLMQRLYRSRYRTIVHIAPIISKRLCVGLRETLRQKRWAGYCAICVNSEATFLLMQRLYKRQRLYDL